VKKAAQAVSDETITTDVKTRLMKDKVARGSDIDVKTSHGVVTIAGAVPTAADRTRIAHLVRETAGVKSVHDKLTVGGTATGTSGTTDDTKIVIKDDTTPAVKKGAHTVAEESKKGAHAVAEGSKKTAHAVTGAAEKGADATTDASVTTAVKTRLMKDDVARSTSIDVDTDDGVVTIHGTVPTQADKDRIGKLVADTSGVKRVVNELKTGGL
jgi:osmotically-inducible protein OsmY